MFESQYSNLSESKLLTICDSKSDFRALIEVDQGARLSELIVGGKTIIEKIDDVKAYSIHYSALVLMRLFV